MNKTNKEKWRVMNIWNAKMYECMNVGLSDGILWMVPLEGRLLVFGLQIFNPPRKVVSLRVSWITLEVKAQGPPLSGASLQTKTFVSRPWKVSSRVFGFKGRTKSHRYHSKVLLLKRMSLERYSFCGVPPTLGEVVT